MSRRRGGILGCLGTLLLLVLVAVLVFGRSLQALLVLDAVFPLGPHPLDLLPAPTVRSVAGMEADLYVPAGGGAHPGLLIVNGAVYQGRRYGPLVGAAQAFARAGYTVMVPELGRLRQYVVGPEVVRDTVRAILLLRRQPEVRPGPIGMYGFSVGGSFALLAAEDPRVAGDVAFVGDIAGYNRLPDMVQAVTTGSLPGVGRRVSLDHIVAYTVLESLIAALPPGPDRDLLQQTLDRAPSEHPLKPFDGLSPGRLSLDDRPVLALIQNRDPGRVPALIAEQPRSVQPLLQVSPALHLERIRAKVWVLHDENDPYVPVEESRELAADPRLRGRVDLSITTILRHTEFDITKLTPGDLLGTYIPNLHLLERFIAQTLGRLD